jgi:hypothetical protein
MPTHGLVLNDLLPWSNIAVRDVTLSLNIVLTQNQGFEKLLGQPEEEGDDTSLINETGMSSDRMLTQKVKVRDEEAAGTRKKHYWIQIGVQIVLYVLLLSLWSADRYDAEVLLSNSMTQGMHKLLTNELLSSKGYSADEFFYEISPYIFTRTRTLPALFSYLSYLQSIIYCVQYCLPFSRFDILPVSRIYSRHSAIGSSPSEFYKESVYLPWPSDSHDDRGLNQTYSFSSPSAAMSIKGFEFWYELEGIKADLDTAYDASVTISLNQLILNNYIDSSTRVV